MLSALNLPFVCWAIGFGKRRSQYKGTTFYLGPVFFCIYIFCGYLPLDWIGGYGGGGLIQVPSGRLICRRSDENSAKYCSAGITRKNLPSVHRRSGKMMTTNPETNRQIDKIHIKAWAWWIFGIIWMVNIFATFTNHPDPPFLALYCMVLAYFMILTYDVQV